jgi:hypothetical protein
MFVALEPARSLWFHQVLHSSHWFALALRRPVFSRRGGRSAHRAESPFPSESNRLEIVQRRLPTEVREPKSQLKASRTGPIVQVKPSSLRSEPQTPRGSRPSGNCCAGRTNNGSNRTTIGATDCYGWRGSEGPGVERQELSFLNAQSWFAGFGSYAMEQAEFGVCYCINRCVRRAFLVWDGIGHRDSTLIAGSSGFRIA